MIRHRHAILSAACIAATLLSVGIPEEAPCQVGSNRTHTVGNMKLTVNAFGNVGGTSSVDEQCSGRWQHNLEFPRGSNLEYLWEAAIWVGAVKDGDTLVTTGGSWGEHAYELSANFNAPEIITARTSIPGSLEPPGSRCPIPFSEDAISEEDYVVTVWDTVDWLRTNPSRIDEVDGRPPKPLELEIVQKSYAWSSSLAQGFVVVDYEIKNIGQNVLKDVFVGIRGLQVGYYRPLSKDYMAADNVVGLIRTVPSPLGEPFRDTVNTVWTADNDGDPGGLRFDSLSPTSAVGLRILKAPAENLQFSFNWWVRFPWMPEMDWGPVKQHSKVQFPLGNLGTPNGDRARYQMMSNGEIDYDMAEAAMSHVGEGWLPPPRAWNGGRDIARGFEANYMVSVGPFDLPPDSTVPFTYAFVGARDFHTQPRNFALYFDPVDPARYYSNLNFESLELISQFVGWMYDAPGADTDGDGYSGRYRIVNGDTVYYKGDGVPDWEISSAPPVPRLSYTTAEGKIVVRWNGRISETARDGFTTLRDFEGYRVYMSRTGREDDFSLLAHRDNINWSRYRWNSDLGRWRVSEPPFSLDSLTTMLDSICRWDYGYPFHPDSFSVAILEDAFLEIVFDERDPTVLDSNYYYFAPYDANQLVDDRLYLDLVASGRDVTGVIRKLYPDAPPDSAGYREDGAEFYPFYEYEYAIDGLQVAEPIFMSVATFDYGNAAVGLQSQESTPTANAIEVWPINSVDTVKTRHPKPGVYPNPYRLVDDYNTAGWENPRGLEPDKERARKMTFYNVPDTCVVSIWSLDGDLIKRLEHRANPAASEASVVVWNLITRNTQAIKTGIYLYSIESRFGADVGKLVIIK